MVSLTLLMCNVNPLRGCHVFDTWILIFILFYFSLSLLSLSFLSLSSSSLLSVRCFLLNNSCNDRPATTDTTLPPTIHRQFLHHRAFLPTIPRCTQTLLFPDPLSGALINIATNQDRVVRFIVESVGVPTIVQVLGDAPMMVRVSVANLVSTMAELDVFAQEEFVRVNVTRPLVSLLSMDTVLAAPMAGRASIHSLVLNLSSAGEANSDGSSRGGHHRREGEKEREVESPESRNDIKGSCAKALWKLSKGCLSSCRKITETKGLLCLAKIIESENGELRLNCLRAVMEIAAVAESNADLRRVAFKPTAPAADSCH